MPYCTLEQLTDRYTERLLLQLTDRADPPAGAIDADVIARAIADSEAVIDGYLGVKYQLPLSETPPMVVDLAQSIAIYKLHPYEPDQKIRSDYEQALKTLLQISKGDIRLPVAGLEPASQSGSGVITNDRQRPFTEENLQGFI